MSATLGNRPGNRPSEPGDAAYVVAVARLVILCGLPGSGKSTTARRIAAASDAVRMCPDEWMTSMGVSLWDADLRARLEAAQWAESQALLCVGHDVVIEWGTWARQERDVLHDWCRAHGVLVSLVHLDVPEDVLRARLDARNALPGETIVPTHHIAEWIDGPFEPPTAEELSRYDSFELPGDGFTSRPWTVADIPFLWDVLYLSIHVWEGWEAPPRSIVDEPDLAHYLRDFGRWPGDDAQVALDEAGTPVAAAYCRRMPADDPGYGFVAADVPELGMAVVTEHRGKGLGRRVLAELLDRHPVMSLSVDLQNDLARSMYESMGFVAVAEEGTALTMLRRPAPSRGT